MRSLPRSRWQHRLGLALAASTVVAVTACSSDIDSRPGDGGGQGMPAFSGPLASDFEKAWKETDSQFVQDVLADEEISEQEWAELETDLDQCLEKSGLELEELEPEGGISVLYQGVPQARGDAAIDVCKETSGLNQLGYIRNELLTNPRGLDPAEAIASCLVRAGVVESSYSAEDYAADMGDGGDDDFPLPFIVDEAAGVAAVEVCNRDPEHSYR